MKSSTFVVALIAAAILGTSVGFAVNYSRYGQYEAKFGKFTFQDDTITPSNIRDEFDLEIDDAGGRLELVGEPVFDFGLMSVGEKGEHVFVVRNVGDGELTLRAGSSTCKCTVGSLGKSVLKPGEETEVNLSWKVQTNADSFRQEAQLLTNDPENEMVALRIAGRVIREFDLNPKAMTFGSRSSEETIDEEITVYSFRADKVAVGEPVVSAPKLKGLCDVEVQELDREQFDEDYRDDATQAFHVKVKLKPGIPEGAISEAIVLPFESLDPDTILTDEDLKLIEAQAKREQAPELMKQMDISSGVIYLGLQGKIVGRLRMVENKKLRRRKTGGYMFYAGTINDGKPVTLKSFMMMKGKDRQETKLKIESVFPESLVSAKVGEAKHQKTMSLVPIEITITPNGKNIDLRGMTGEEENYGRVVIVTDTEKAERMNLFINFRNINP